MLNKMKKFVEEKQKESTFSKTNLICIAFLLG